MGRNMEHEFVEYYWPHKITCIVYNTIATIPLLRKQPLKQSLKEIPLNSLRFYKI